MCLMCVEYNLLNTYRVYIYRVTGWDIVPGEDGTGQWLPFGKAWS
jgi:hypothetical protein